MEIEWKWSRTHESSVSSPSLPFPYAANLEVSYMWYLKIEKVWTPSHWKMRRPPANLYGLSWAGTNLCCVQPLEFPGKVMYYGCPAWPILTKFKSAVIQSQVITKQILCTLCYVNNCDKYQRTGHNPCSKRAYSGDPETKPTHIIQKESKLQGHLKILKWYSTNSQGNRNSKRKISEETGLYQGQLWKHKLKTQIGSWGNCHWSTKLLGLLVE